MQTGHIHYVSVLSESLSINKAARELRLTPSYMSRVLKSVEGELGVRLFERSHEGLTPTEEGNHALESLLAIDRIYQGLLPHNAEEAPGSQSISGEYFFYCRPAINNSITHSLYRYSAAHFPNVTLQFVQSSEANTLEAVAMDNGIIGMIVHDPMEELAIPPNVRMVRGISQTKLAAILSNDHALAHNKSISMARLITKDLIFYDNYSTIEESYVFKLLSKYGKVNVRYVIGNMPTFMSMLKETECITVGAINGRYDEGLTVLPIRDSPNTCYSLVFNEQDDDSPVVQSLIEMLSKAKAR